MSQQIGRLAPTATPLPKSQQDGYERKMEYFPGPQQVDNLTSAQTPVSADVEILDRNQQMTALLFEGFAQRDKSIVQQALRAGADVNGLDARGRTPLMYALDYSWTDIAKDLFSKSSPDTLNAIDKQGNTALMYACMELTDIPFLTQLLERSSPETINAVNVEGLTVLLSLVCKHLNHEIAQHLLPLLLPRLTGENLYSAYRQPNIILAQTAWEIAHKRGPGSWKTIARRIGEAMLMECAQYRIPRRNYHESPFSNPMMALAAINDFLCLHLQQTGQYQEDGSQLLRTVNDAPLALHDPDSLLNVSLAEYAASQAP